MPASQHLAPGRTVILDPDLRAHRRYHALRGQLLLVRPDGHIACRAPLDRPDIPERYLERVAQSTVPEADLRGVQEVT